MPRKTLNWSAPGARKSLRQRRVGTSGEGEYESRGCDCHLHVPVLRRGRSAAGARAVSSAGLGLRPPTPRPASTLHVHATPSRHWRPLASGAARVPRAGSLCSVRSRLPGTVDRRFLETCGVTEPCWPGHSYFGRSGSLACAGPCFPPFQTKHPFPAFSRGWIGRAGRGRSAWGLGAAVPRTSLCGLGQSI